MGVRLLNRTARRQSLTEFGVAHYDRCGLVLAEAQAAEELAADQLTQPSERLRVALPVLFGRRCVTPVLLELAQRHPGLELDLSFDDRLVDLAEGGFDLAIRTGALADSASVIAKRVACQRMIVCASPSYLAEHGVPQRVEDLPEHQAVVYRRAGSIPPWQFPLADGTELAILPPNKLRLDDMAAIADAAAAGLGWPSLRPGLCASRCKLVRLPGYCKKNRNICTMCTLPGRRHPISRCELALPLTRWPRRYRGSWFETSQPR